MPDSFDGFCSLWPGVRWGICIPPPAIFKNIFNVYNFSIISNLFYSNISLTPYARIIENVRTTCIIFDERLRIKVKKCKQNLPEIYSKSTKMAITACKFSKIYRGSMPPDPLKPFVFLNQLQISSAEKLRLKKMWKLWPSPLKFLLRSLRWY